MKRTGRQCSRCVMDSSDSEIVFDVNGHCNHCTHFLTHLSARGYQSERSDAACLKLVDEMKNAGRHLPYDCVIGISGGIDSCYLAFEAKRLGLRALLVHMDNGWNSDLAVKNIKQVVDKLKFDYQSYVLNWAEFRAVQVAFLKASIVDAEIPTDVAIPAAMHAVAAEHGVRYVLSGGNLATEGILPSSWGYNAKDSTLYRSIVAQHCTISPRSIPLFGFAKEFYYKFVKQIRIVYLLNFVRFSKTLALETLRREFNWNDYRSKHGESRYTAFLQSYILPVKFNLDYRRATLSTQICTGEVTREQALECLEQSPFDVTKIEDEKRYVCKKLELSLQEFESIMQLPVKTYRDYPNAQKRLEFGYSVYRKVTQKFRSVG